MLHPRMTSGGPNEARTCDLGTQSSKIRSRILDSYHVELLDKSFPRYGVKEFLVTRIPDIIRRRDYDCASLEGMISEMKNPDNDPEQRVALAHCIGFLGDIYPRELSTNTASIAYKNAYEVFENLFASDSLESQATQTDELRRLGTERKLLIFTNMYNRSIEKMAYHTWSDSDWLTVANHVSAIIFDFFDCIQDTNDQVTDMYIKREVLKNHKASELLYRVKRAHARIVHNSDKISPFLEFCKFANDMIGRGEDDDVVSYPSDALKASLAGMRVVQSYQIAEQALTNGLIKSEADEDSQQVEILKKVKRAFEGIKGIIEHPFLRKTTPERLYDDLDMYADDILEHISHPIARTVYNMLVNRASEKKDTTAQTYDLAFILKVKDLIMSKFDSSMDISPLREEIFHVYGLAADYDNIKSSKTFAKSVREYTDALFVVLHKHQLIDRLGVDIVECFQRYVN